MPTLSVNAGLFLKNLAMAGGLLFVTGAGAGSLALQRAV